MQIQKVAELTEVPLVSCRPWLCMPRIVNGRPVGPIRPCAALLPQHMQMTISEVRERAGYIPRSHAGRFSVCDRLLFFQVWLYQE